MTTSNSARYFQMSKIWILALFKIRDIITRVMMITNVLMSTKTFKVTMRKRMMSCSIAGLYHKQNKCSRRPTSDFLRGTDVLIPETTKAPGRGYGEGRGSFRTYLAGCTTVRPILKTKRGVQLALKAQQRDAKK
jgi:hypothetical protein